MLINNPVITGSFLVNGVNVAGITGSSELSSSFLIVSASYAAASASLSTRLTNVETTASVLTTASASFAVVSSSYASASGSLSTRVTNLESTSSTVSSSFASTSGSIAGRVNIIETSYATTGSNNFTKPQQISDVSNAISFTSTASLYTAGGLRVSKDSFVSGTAYFNNVVVYGTSSIQYITSSQVNIGTNIITVNTDTPAVRFGGLAVFDSGSTALTGSLLWDSLNNRWIYSNPSGSTYDGGMLISGPRNSTGLGNEVGTTACAVMIGQGGDHITSSGIFSYGNATCFYGTSLISGSGLACFSGQVCSATIVSAGTIQGTTVYGSTAICGGVICGTNATFNGDVLITNSSNAQIGFNTTGALNSTGAYLYFNRSGVNKWTAGMGPQDGSDDYQIVTAGIKALNVKASTGIAILACQTCAPGMDIMPSGIGVSTLGGIMRVVTTGTSTGIAVGQSNANRYTHFAANDIQVFNDDYFIATRCAFPLSIGTCYTARLTFAATGIACFSCQVCANSTGGISGTFRSSTFFGSIDLENTGGDVAGKWNVQSVSGAQIGGSGGSSFGIYSYGASAYRLFINSSGNVGIGCTNPSYTLDVNGVIRASGTCGNNIIGTRIYASGTGTCTGFTLNSTLIYQGSGGEFNITNPGSYPNVAFTINTSGNVGIGTTTPCTTLTVEGANSAFPLTYNSGFGNIHIQTNETTATQNFGGTLTFGGLGRTSGPTEKFIWAAIAGRKEVTTSGDPRGYLQFGTTSDDTNQTKERMRITSCGLLKVQNSGVTYESSTAGVNEIGTCANDTNLVFRNVRGSLTGARAGVDVFYAYAQPNSTDASFYEAADSTDGSTRTLRFKVASNGTVYARSTSITLISSDCKLKTDIVDYDKGLCEVISMKPRYYKYKDNLSQIHSGFIAQEMNEALPGSMIQSYIDQDCNPVMTYQVDWYPLLVNAIKQQQCEIKQLKTCLGIN